MNPFQTKTAIVDKFDDSPPVAQAETILPPPSAVETGSTDPEPSVEKEQALKSEDVKPKKEFPPKPWLKKTKKSAVKPAKEEATEDETKTEEEVRVPSKGYNLDFLDNLDDPNFNPFETKTAVVDKFDDSTPVTENAEPSVTDNKLENASVVEKAEEEKKPKKELPVKPWLKAKKKSRKAPAVENNEIQPIPNEECQEEKVPNKGYSLDFLDNLDDPNFNPFETKTSVIPKFDEPSEPTPSQETPQDVGGPSQDETSTDIKGENVEPTQNDLKKETEDSKTTSGGYNLDFIDKLDDPNFNPFETKSNVTNNEPVEVTPPESGSDTTLVLDTDIPDTETVIESNDLNSTVTKDSTPEFEDREPEIVAPVIPEPVRAESPQSNSSGYSSIPPAPEPELSFVIPEPAN